MSSKISMQLQSALLSTGLVQPVSEKFKGGFVEVLCRQVPGQEKGWLKIVDLLLVAADELPDAEFHICRRYVRRQGQMVFGWHLSIDCKNVKRLQEVVENIIKSVLESAKPSLTEPEPEPEVLSEAQQRPQARSAARSRPLAPGQRPPAQNAPPRAPNAPGRVVGTPPAATKKQEVHRSRDAKGKVTIIEEMPIPHVYADMNRPNEKGKGATFTGGGG